MPTSRIGGGGLEGGNTRQEGLVESLQILSVFTVRMRQDC